MGHSQCDAAEEMNPELVALAKRLHRRNPETGQRLSLRAIAAELASQGLVNMHGPSICRGIEYRRWCSADAATCSTPHCKRRRIAAE
jgi:hypothetical protein